MSGSEQNLQKFRFLTEASCLGTQYKVMAAYCGLIHEKESHLNRLESSLDSVGMRLPFSRTKIERTLEESLKKESGQQRSNLPSSGRGAIPKKS